MTDSSHIPLLSPDQQSTPTENFRDDLSPLLSEKSHPPSKWRSYCYSWGGLFSYNRKTRLRARLVWGSLFIILSVFTLVLFLVIIPSMIQSIVDESDLSLVSSDISMLTNESFVSTSVLQLSHAKSPAPAKIRLHAVDVQWPHTGQTLLTLSKSNQLPVKNHQDLTMTDTARVKDSQALAAFTTSLVKEATATWALSGSADVSTFVKTTVKFHKNLELIGFNDFPISPVVQQTNLTDGSLKALFAEATVRLTSTSNVQLSFQQPLYYHFEFNGERLGIGQIPDYIMTPGSTTLTTFLSFSYQNNQQYKQLMRLLSDYSCGKDVTVKMNHFYLSPSITWLAPALDSIEFETVLPATRTPMVQLIAIRNKITVMRLPFTLTLYNPQSIPVKLTSIMGNLSYEGSLIANVELPVISPAIEIPPYTTVVSQEFESRSYVNAASIKLLREGSGLGSIYQTICVSFGAFETSFEYYQDNVPLKVV